MQKSILALTFVLLALAALCSPAQGAYYFSTTGNALALSLTSCSKATPCAFSIVGTLLSGLVDTSPTFVLLDLNSSVNLSSSSILGSTLTVQFDTSALAASTGSLIFNAQTALNIVANGSIATTVSKLITFNAPSVTISSLSATGLTLSLTPSTAGLSYTLNVADSVLAGLTLSTNPTTMTVSNVTTKTMNWAATNLQLSNLKFQGASGAVPILSGTTVALTDSVFTSSSSLDATVSASATMTLSNVSFSSARTLAISATSSLNWASSKILAASAGASIAITSPTTTLQSITFDSAALTITGATSAALTDLTFSDTSTLTLSQQAAAMLNTVTLADGKLIASGIASLDLSGCSFTASYARVALNVTGVSSSSPITISGSTFNGAVIVAAGSLSVSGSEFTATSGSIGKQFKVLSASSVALNGVDLAKFSVDLATQSLSISNSQISGDDESDLRSFVVSGLTSPLSINASSSFSKLLLSASAAAAINIETTTFSDSALNLVSTGAIAIKSSIISGSVNSDVSILNLTAVSVDFSDSTLSASSSSSLPTVALASTDVTTAMTFIGSLEIPRLQLSSLASLSLDGSLVINAGLDFAAPAASNVVLDVSGKLTLPVLNTTVTSASAKVNISTPHIVLGLTTTNAQLNALVDISIDATNLTVTFSASVDVLSGSNITLGTDLVVSLPQLVDVDPLLDLVLTLVESVLKLEIAGSSCTPACQHGGTCIGLNICNCASGWASMGCTCPTTSLPSFVSCSTNQMLSWVINASTILQGAAQSIVLPDGINLVVQGDLGLSNGASLQLSSTSSVDIQGTFSSDGGSVIISPSVNVNSGVESTKRADVPVSAPEATPSNASCSFNLTSYIVAQNLNLSSSSNITVVINMTSLVDYYGADSGVQCLGSNPIINITNSAVVDGIITVIIIGTNSSTNARADVVSAGDPSISETSVSLTLSVSTPNSGSCSSSSAKPGLISVFVNPCAGTNPDGSSNPAGKALKWYYYGIPIIAVLVITVVVAVVLLSVPSFRHKIAPYRGTRMG